MTSLRGQPFTATSAAGASSASGKGSTPHWYSASGSPSARSPRLLRPSWTASRSKSADQAGPRGYDAGKKIKGRKRHVLADTLGLIISVLVTSSAVHDRDGARRLLPWLCHHGSRLRLIWADGGYAGALVNWLWQLRTQRRVRLEIVKRPEGQRSFPVLPKRWIVERTLGWLMKQRRLRCDYEHLITTSETMIYIAMIRLMLRRLHP